MTETTESLTDILKRRMALQGPMSVADYMTECLAHPVHGYYQKQDPLGVSGDFTTAPEISQMFGELLGLWSGVCWSLLGSPEKIHLVELGPGRGTLMSDALRAAQGLPGFVEAAAVHLVETSPALREKQSQALSAQIKPRWHDSIVTLPDDAPLIILANEFFDALPIRQYVKTEDGWRERGITWDAESGAFQFVLSGALSFPAEELPPAQVGGVFELCPLGCQIARDLGQRIANQQGAILAIDYGHLQSAAGETLQAVKDHQYFDVLQDPGSADLTTHVDFQALARSLAEGGATPAPGMAQGEFLVRLGIQERAGALAKSNPEKAEEISEALKRLIDEAEMGTLFKVLAASSGLQAPGFDQPSSS